MSDFLKECSVVLENLSREELGELPGNMAEFLFDLDFICATDNRTEFVGDRKKNAQLLRAAGKLDRLFPLPSPDAPNLFAFGGEADPADLAGWNGPGSRGSISGCNSTFRDAFLSCVGEGIEYLSQFEQEGDLADECPDVPLVEIRPSSSSSDQSSSDDYVSARRADDDAQVLISADDCIRRIGEPKRQSGLSTGCGAGLTIEQASLHGLLELIERDAVAMWWHGGKPGRPVDLASPAMNSASHALRHLRGGLASRTCWLIDITTEFDLPCIAAISARPDGKFVACGTAAATTPDAAAVSAVHEMCLMEISYDVVDAKIRERGQADLNEIDHRHLKRADGLSATDCRLLHPSGLPHQHRQCAASCEKSRWRWLVELMSEHDIETYTIDFTRAELQVPAVRVVAPALQLFPDDFVSSRLERCIDAFGGGKESSMGLLPY